MNLDIELIYNIIQMECSKWGGAQVGAIMA